MPAEYGCCQPACPLLIDLSGQGFRLTSRVNGVEFDMNGDGNRERIAWTAPGAANAWLGIDLNGNGIIDNGKELFGNFSKQPPSTAPNGFLALAEYDMPGNGGNANGRIDSGDAVFSRLLLWTDANHDGVCAPEEVTPWSAVNAEIDLKYHESKKTDEFGNEFRYRSRLREVKGNSLNKWIVDVFLSVEKPAMTGKGISLTGRKPGCPPTGTPAAAKDR